MGILQPGTDNEAIRRIANEISKPFYKKLDFWIMAILEVFVICLAIYYGRIQVSPILEEREENYNSMLNHCKYGTSSFTMRDGSERTCEDLFPDLKK